MYTPGLSGTSNMERSSRHIGFDKVEKSSGRSQGSFMEAEVIIAPSEHQDTYLKYTSVSQAKTLATATIMNTTINNAYFCSKHSVYYVLVADLDFIVALLIAYFRCSR
jgi:hypothetical protein